MLLKINDKGENVRLLQELLNIEADGYFGKLTLSAVKEFQVANKLYPDGIVGEKNLGSTK